MVEVLRVFRLAFLRKNNFFLKFFSKEKQRGFVFVFEAILAFILFFSFLSIGSNISYENQYANIISQKQMVYSTLSFLDQNASVLRVLDLNSSSYTNYEKMAMIKEEVMELLPNTMDFRIILREYNINDVEKCKDNPNFDACFSESNFLNSNDTDSIFSPVPTNKQVIFEKMFFIQKGNPLSCAIGHSNNAAFSEFPSFYNNSQIFLSGQEKISNGKNYCSSCISKNDSDVFSKENLEVSFSDFSNNHISDPEENFVKISFSDNGDEEIKFGFEPQFDQAECGKTLRFDLNIEVPTIAVSGGRPILDLFVLPNISKPMEKTNVKLIPDINQDQAGFVSGGEFTIFPNEEHCSNLTNWVEVGDFYVGEGIFNDASLSNTSIRLTMNYSGYDGACSNPRVRVKDPSGGYYYGVFLEDGVVDLNIGLIERGTFFVELWGDVEFDYNLEVYNSKIISIISAASLFFSEIEDNDYWKKSGSVHERDQIGYIEFNSSTRRLNSLRANYGTIYNAVSGLELSDDPYADTAKAIRKGVDEVLHPNHSNDGLKFLLLFDDGLYTGEDPIDAALFAADKNVLIYVVGFGSDANNDLLEEIATITGGSYFYLDMQDDLGSLIEFIANEIGRGEQIVGISEINNASLSIPLPIPCEVDDISLVSSVGGTCGFVEDYYFIDFDLGSFNGDNLYWEGYFEIEIPCDFDFSCSISDLNFEIAYLKGKVEADGDSADVVFTFEIKKHFPFFYKDLQLRIDNAIIPNANEIMLFYTITNNGKLSIHDDTDICLNQDGEYFNCDLVEIGLEPGSRKSGVLTISEENVGRITGSETGSGDVTNFVFVEINTGEETTKIAECPAGNRSSFKCEIAPVTRFYSFEIWVWNK